jgi:hypothetical protein
MMPSIKSIIPVTVVQSAGLSKKARPAAKMPLSATVLGKEVFGARKLNRLSWAANEAELEISLLGKEG